MKKAVNMDALAVGLVAAWLGWAILTATLNQRTQPLMTPYFTSPVFMAFGIAIGRRLGRRPAEIQIGCAALAAAAYVLTTVWFVGGPGGGPLGYSNANAALAMQLFGLTVLLALSAAGLARRLLLTAAGLLVVSVVVADCDAANILLLFQVAAVAFALSSRARGRWWPVVIGALGVVAALATVTTLTLLHTWPSRVVAGLSETRHQLWRDALRLWSKNPLLGAGPGSFSHFTPLAKDSTLSTAHMSLFQIGAETGLIGVALFTVLVAAAYVIGSRGTPAATVVVSAAISVLLIHSFVDHLLEFWPVMLTLGVSLGVVDAARGPEKCP